MITRSRQAAFTLIELIVVIVLLGVLAGGAGLLITTPIQAYSDQLRRQQLVDQAEMALRQIARDVRRALPNSIRISPVVPAGWALEMVNSIDGARYRDEFGGVFTADTDILDFLAPDTEFNFLGQLNNTALGVLALGQRLVIYNTVPDNFYADAVSNNNPGIVTPSTTTLILTANGNEHHLTMAPAFQFSQQSPGQRAFIVDGPISYICTPASRNMTRYSNYAYQDPQPTAAPVGGAASGLVVTQLAACSISYQAGAAQRGGLVTIEITLDDASGESITLLHQVHVDNVP
ncbi:MAG: prepilin-type N-terminal cleavage/methylation domain-containing protein [Proteobacteria bacterium]|nr:prepilin-type N-terminal cleavage/methylation domain-containing protein [Pseudomonadota bacterium]